MNSGQNPDNVNANSHKCVYFTRSQWVFSWKFQLNILWNKILWIWFMVQNKILSTAAEVKLHHFYFLNKLLVNYKDSNRSVFKKPMNVEISSRYGEMMNSILPTNNEIRSLKHFSLPVSVFFKSGLNSHENSSFELQIFYLSSTNCATFQSLQESFWYVPLRL